MSHITARAVYRMAQLTLEAQSAHGIHSGQGDLTHDVLLVRDANGLPTLTGSSLAGVLRHAYRLRYGELATNQLFGTLHDTTSFASRLTVGWGMVHDSNDRPCEGLRENIADDPLLAFLQDAKPLVRQRVRLGHTGAACESGKFDVTLVPQGVRYSSWLGYWCDGSEASQALWSQLLQLLQSTSLALGHSTRSGNGQFSVQRLAHAEWNMRCQAQVHAYRQRHRSRTHWEGLQELSLIKPAGVSVCLQLQAEAGWRIGGGERSLNKLEKVPDLLPQHELQVRWDEHGRAQLNSNYYLLPGSAIKGALRHRVAYHYRCLTKDYVGAGSLPEPESCVAVQQLFGYAEDSSADQANAHAGVLCVRDLSIPHDKAQTAVLMHNRIDRFTGGVIHGALFSEEVLWNTSLELRIDLLSGSEAVSVCSRQALQLTLEDLANGWLALGANGSRGLGVFNAVVDGPQWSDNGTWVNTK